MISNGCGGGGVKVFASSPDEMCGIQVVRDRRRQCQNHGSMGTIKYLL